MRRFWIKKIGLAIIALAVLAFVGIIGYDFITTPKEEGVAHLRSVTVKPNTALIEYLGSYIYGQTARPDGLIDLPSQISDSEHNIIYFSLPVGKNTLFAVTQRTASGQINTWIDTNYDQHLSDEKTLSGTARKRSGQRGRVWYYIDFGKHRITGKTFTSAPFYFLCSDRGDYCIVQPVNCMQGKIRLGKWIYRVAAIDGDYDGKWSTLYTPVADYRYWGCDSLVVDHNRYGLFGWKIYDPGKLVPLGKYYKFTKERFFVNTPEYKENSECYFSVNFSADGKTLWMKPAQPAMGTLKIDGSKRLAVQFFSDSATQSVNFRDEIKLPAGLYQMHWGELTLTDKEGMEHELRPDFREDIRKGRLEIKEGEIAAIDPGPPFTVKSDVNKRSDNTLSIYAGLVGNEGEEYGLRISRDMERPILKILNENNEEVHSGSMEFG